MFLEDWSLRDVDNCEIEHRCWVERGCCWESTLRACIWTVGPAWLAQRWRNSSALASVKLEAGLHEHKLAILMSGTMSVTRTCLPSRPPCSALCMLPARPCKHIPFCGLCWCCWFCAYTRRLLAPVSIFHFVGCVGIVDSARNWSSWDSWAGAGFRSGWD
jgi:hypothetical protein